tara:strand:+ start:106044 stop:108227 length:2184 start_codon:yes stop_codon:yes gene_type:complete
MFKLLFKPKTLVVGLFPLCLSAQFSYTGGPLNTDGESRAIWANGDTAFMAFNKNLYRTFNGGLNWELLKNGIANNCDPRTIEYSSNTLIVGTNTNSRIYRSTDHGDNFQGGTGNMSSILIPTASTSGPNFSMIGGTTSSPYRYDFAQGDWVDIGATGITHGMAYIGQDSIWECTGSINSGTTRFSTDNGMSWTTVATEPNTDVGGGVILNTIAQDFVKVGIRILVASNLNGFAVLYTDDNGSTWSASDLSSTSYSDYGKRFVKFSNNHLLSVNLAGIWKSTDRGATWTMIQSLAGIYSIVKWKNDHILVATTNGLFEFDNHGEGNMIKKHGISTSTSNIIEGPNSTVYTATENGFFQYDGTTNSWTLLSDSVYGPDKLGGSFITKINDTIFVCGNGIYSSGDNGQTFSIRSYSPFSFQKPSAIIEHQGKKILATRQKWAGGGTPKDPKIFYSSDDGKTYTEASFSNNISFGYGGGSDNFVEAFYQTNTGIIADMNAGYALSNDGGLNWTYFGDPWSISIMATKGTDIYHFQIAGTSQNQRDIEVSSDNGQSWTSCSLNGLPNSSSPNYQGFFGVWNAGGEIYTYNATDAPEGLYKYDKTADSWSLEANTQSVFDGPMLHLSKLGSAFFGSWYQQGICSTQPSISLEENRPSSLIQIYPNPSEGIIKISIPTNLPCKLEIMDLNGKLIRESILNKGQAELKLEGQSPGVYIIQLTSKEFAERRKIILK